MSSSTLADILSTNLEISTSTSSGGEVKSSTEEPLIMNAKHPLYSTWGNMWQRCFNKQHKNYPQYGGRGITVCQRWLTFANFVLDMGNKPAGFTLDRIDNNGNYEPSNCRWASVSTQQYNKRPYKNNISGIPGIFYQKSLDRYQVKYKQRYGGRYKTLQEAKNVLLKLQQKDFNDNTA